MSAVGQPAPSIPYGRRRRNRTASPPPAAGKSGMRRRGPLGGGHERVVRRFPPRRETTARTAARRKLAKAATGRRRTHASATRSCRSASAGRGCGVAAMKGREPAAARALPRRRSSVPKCRGRDAPPAPSASAMAGWCAGTAAEVEHWLRPGGAHRLNEDRLERSEHRVEDIAIVDQASAPGPFQSWCWSSRTRFVSAWRRLPGGGARWSRAPRFRSASSAVGRRFHRPGRGRALSRDSTCLDRRRGLGECSDTARIE
jgi:hypothetical protein